jgi:hypothetical protein
VSSNTVHVIFGNYVHASAYSQRKVVNSVNIVVATHPERIQPLMKESVTTIKVIRLPKEIWEPTTHPCKTRTDETERIIKGYQRLGVTVVEENGF